jgi:hypothetical protein
VTAFTWAFPDGVLNSVALGAIFSFVARARNSGIERPAKNVDSRGAERVFKTPYFAKQAKDAGISERELCDAATELRNGQGDRLGGSVWKKRLDKNRQRAIVLTKPGGFWVYVYLFAKKDRENITPKELRAFKKLSGDYQAADVGQMLKNGDLHEICKDGKKR